MTNYNRSHQRGNHKFSSLALAQDLARLHPHVVMNLLATVLDLNTALVGQDLDDTAERLHRYSPRNLTKDAAERLTSSENQEDKNVLHHYLAGN